jgi:hypothetical protein
MKNPNPKTGWRLRWARFVCRRRGHDVGKIVKYSPLWVLVGWGCRRCEEGAVTRYRSKGPLPVAVKAELAKLPADPVFP